jgi:hypothetical protein
MLIVMDLWSSKLWTSQFIIMIENWKVHLKIYSNLFIVSDLACEWKWNNTLLCEKFP